MLKKHELKYCPRCGKDFECKVGDINRCQCTTVLISGETRQFLEQTHYDCLCSACLQQIDHLVRYSQQHLFPVQKEMLIEGLHYTIENGMFVFTELYHIQRGYCCRNGCRNCAYGFKKTEENVTCSQKTNSPK
ncbi:MAG: cysteine-rich CWC family protein [Sphingobacteriales bacterium]|nr:cysteine-rich CWC family protein [Sphingobacteriales bacterium]